MDIQTGNKDEAPRRVVCPTPHWGRRLGCPLPEKYFDFGSQNSDFKCILDTIFTVQLFGLNAKPAYWDYKAI